MNRQNQQAYDDEVAELRAQLAAAHARADAAERERDDAREGRAEWARQCNMTSEREADLRAQVATLARERDEARLELERSRYKGCDSYPRAIGEIEGVLGITGAVPLSDTVDAVRTLKAAERERDEAREKLAEWQDAFTFASADEAKQCRAETARLRAALEAEQRTHAETRALLAVAQQALDSAHAREDRARPVLEACDAIGNDVLHAPRLHMRDWLARLVNAELARRAATGEKT